MIIVLHKKNVHSVGRIIYKKMETYRFLVTKIVYYKPTSWYIYIHCNQAETSWFFFCNTAITVIIGRHFGVSINSTFTEICLPMIWFL